MKNFACKNFAFLAGLSRQISALRRDRKGVSAVEFAMVLPLMVALYIGTVEISQGVAIQRKVTLATRTVADLASQTTSINNSDAANLGKAALAVIAPYSGAPLNGAVSAVNIDANGIAKIAWSDPINGGTPKAANSTVTVPPALNVPNSQLIWSELRYQYKPDFGAALVGEINLFEQIYMRPRLSETVARPNS
jgi:Flp pilus assembly protein TadG